jgi:carboxyl-terminal processing protease
MKFAFSSRLCNVRFSMHQRPPCLLPALLAVFFLLGFPLGASPTNKVSTDMGPVAATVARMLEQGHYLHPLSISEKNPPHPENESQQTMTERVLQNYLQMLDYNHLYLTKGDVDEFRDRFSPTLATDILRGDLTAPREIFSRFRLRVEDRVAKNKKLASAPRDYSSDKTVQIDRKKAPWPADLDEADRLWADRIEAELLQEHLNEHPVNPPAKVVSKRYEQFLKSINEQGDEDVIAGFLKALCQSYDPHSEYMSPSDMENFNIQMKLSLVGIGAVLRPDDGYTRIVEIVPGGPADKDGRLKSSDRITAVAQGKGPFEDVVDMKLDKVVEKIRGSKGTQVRLQVIPANTTDPSKRSVVELTRDEVKMKESEAKGEVIETKDADGRKIRTGWLTIPSFYAEMDRHGEGDAKSVTRDVRRIIERMQKEGIEGLVIDLRRDGGGSLTEAQTLSGLFVGSGPVVQAKDANGRVSLLEENDGGQLYSGPIVVLINRLSASASEIFAAALQDYGRAVVVGDERSFGKGTVQTVVDVGKFMPIFQSQGSKAGSLKLTIQKFYRVSGGSTQHRGVLSDIVLPSTTDTPEIGESSLPNPLAYDEVAPRAVNNFNYTSPLLDTLRQRSMERVSKDPEFRFITEDMKIFREKRELNRLSLNEKMRKAELAEEKRRKEARKEERKQNAVPEPTSYEVTLDTVDKPVLPPVVPKKKPAKSLPPKDLEGEEDEEDGSVAGTPDPVKREAIRILQDFSTLGHSLRTAINSPKEG